MPSLALSRRLASNRGRMTQEPRSAPWRVRSRWVHPCRKRIGPAGMSARFPRDPAPRTSSPEARLPVCRSHKKPDGRRGSCVTALPPRDMRRAGNRISRPELKGDDRRFPGSSSCCADVARSGRAPRLVLNTLSNGSTPPRQPTRDPFAATKVGDRRRPERSGQCHRTSREDQPRRARARDVASPGSSRSRWAPNLSLAAAPRQWSSRDLNVRHVVMSSQPSI